jgi:CubicO group peptidase (beta-lactamase class C family)
MPMTGVGFGLGGAVLLDSVKAQILGSEGEFTWGGVASTAFWIDPVEEISAVFMTQLIPSSTYPIRRELRVLVYQALID